MTSICECVAIVAACDTGGGMLFCSSHRYSSVVYGKWRTHRIFFLSPLKKTIMQNNTRMQIITEMTYYCCGVDVCDCTVAA